MTNGYAESFPAQQDGSPAVVALLLAVVALLLLR
jgi:hypothetical protein